MFSLKSRIHFLTDLRFSNETHMKFMNQYFTTFNCYRNQRRNQPREMTSDEESYGSVKGKDTEFPYKVVNPYDARLTALLTRSKSRRDRYQTKTIMLEGKRLISDALVSGAKPIMILFTRKNLIEDLPLLDEYVTPDKTVLHKIPYKYLQNWSNLTTSPGLTGIFEMPNLENKILNFSTLPITLVCDNIREPGNLGAILRIAAAIPVRRVVLLTGCVDLWDPKVTRSSCGALFNLRIENNASWEDIRDTCSGNVIIADHLSGEGDDSMALSAEDYVNPVDIEDEVIDDMDEDNDEILDKNELRKTLNTHSYYDVSYKNYNSFVIIVGGETEGLSEETFLYAKENKGIRVNIPLSPCINSLNAATALGIITFEIKRQLERK